MGWSAGDEPGDVESGEVECVRGECKDVRAVLVAPPLLVVVIVRGCEGCDDDG